MMDENTKKIEKAIEDTIYPLLFQKYQTKDMLTIAEKYYNDYKNKQFIQNKNADQKIWKDLDKNLGEKNLKCKKHFEEVILGRYLQHCLQEEQEEIKNCVIQKTKDQYKNVLQLSNEIKLFKDQQQELMRDINPSNNEELFHVKCKIQIAYKEILSIKQQIQKDVVLQFDLRNKKYLFKKIQDLIRHLIKVVILQQLPESLKQIFCCKSNQKIGGQCFEDIQIYDTINSVLALNSSIETQDAQLDKIDADKQQLQQSTTQPQKTPQSASPSTQNTEQNEKDDPEQPQEKLSLIALTHLDDQAKQVGKNVQINAQYVNQLPIPQIQQINNPNHMRKEQLDLDIKIKQQFGPEYGNASAQNIYSSNPCQIQQNICNAQPSIKSFNQLPEQK